MNGNNDIRSIAHELFHAFQINQGQGGTTYYNEVEAYVFSEIVCNQYFSKPNAKGDFRCETAFLSRHPQTAEGKEYQDAMSKLAIGFNNKLFNRAVDLFQSQSGANATGIYDVAPYKKCNGNEKPLLPFFYPSKKK